MTIKYMFWRVVWGNVPYDLEVEHFETYAEASKFWHSLSRNYLIRRFERVSSNHHHDEKVR